MSFRCRIPVRFGDIDQAGIAYYPTLFDYCHVAFEEFFAGALNRPYPKVLLKEKLGFPMVHVEADFIRPLKYGDVVVMDVGVLKLGTSSVTFRFRGSVRGKRAFEIRGTTACVDMRRFRGVPVPERYRRLFGRHRVAAGRLTPD